MMKQVIATISILLVSWLQLTAGSGTDTLTWKYDDLRKFTRKGSWLAGGTFSLQSSNTNNKNQLIRYVEEDRVNIFTVKADAAYAFLDNNFAGLGILYGQTHRSGNYENSDGELYFEQQFGNSISFTPFLKNFTPLDKKGRFNIVTQIEFLNQLDQGITETNLNDNITRKLTAKYTGLIGIRPGISVFVIKNVAFETTLNVAGIKYTWLKTEITDQPVSRASTGTIDFKIDLFQLNIGIFVYIQ